MISALSWVPRGAAKKHPEKYEMTEEEYKRITDSIGQEIEQVKDEMATETVVDDELKDFNMDTYDQEEGLTGIPVFGSSKGLTYHENEEDPYIVMDKSFDEEETEEVEILETDNLLVACKTEDEVSHLEVYVYESEHDNLYVHHDIMLPSFPLCVEWMNSASTKGNFVAVGTFEPEIEIWDLDTIDVMYPAMILGKSHKRSKISKNHHISAVTCLSWNKTSTNLLLSGSADSTVKLWDMQQQKAVFSYQHHTDKVVATEWNPKEQTVFLTGGYDRNGRVCALDSRVPDQVASWTLGSDVECLKWDPTKSERFFCSTEDGIVRCFDVRQGLKDNFEPLFTINAHDSACCSLDISPSGLMVTGSADKQIKVWDIRSEIKCLASKNLQVGKVFSSQFCVDSPFVVATAGSKGKIVIWNLMDNPAVRKTFNLSGKGQEFVKIATDDEESAEE